MNTEEILVRMGVDSSSFSRGLEEMKEKVDHFGQHIQKGLMRGLVFHPIVQGLEEAFHEGTKWLAEQVYTLQYNLGEHYTEALDRFRHTLHEINRDRWAMEKFREDLKEAARQSGMLAGELNSLEMGRAQNSIEGLGDKIGRIKEELQHEEQVMEQLESTLADSLSIEEQAQKVLKRKIELAKTELELKEKFAEKDRKAGEDAEKKQKSLNELTAQQLETREKMAESRRRSYEGFMPSVQDLAQSGWGDIFGRFHAGPLAGIASQILNLEAQARTAFTYNNPAFARRLIDVRNAQYDRLAAAGIVPQRQEKVAEAQIQMAQDLKDIREGRARLEIHMGNMA